MQVFQRWEQYKTLCTIGVHIVQWYGSYLTFFFFTTHFHEVETLEMVSGLFAVT